MSFGLLFSGQGLQHAQMLPWLARDALVARTEAALGIDDWRRALHDPAWARCNRNAQLLLTGIGLAAWCQLSPRLAAPAAIAGYSVGELAAFSAAGAFDAPQAIELAGARAQAMDACNAGGGLLSVSGLEASAIGALCARTGVAVAICIDVDAVIVGGPPPALDAAHRFASEAGAKCSLLDVAIASHTPAMAPAALAFEQVLQSTTCKPPGVALFSNASGERVLRAAQIAPALSRQVAQTVLWSACLDAMHERRLDCLLEIGPGSALATMWNRRHPEVPARSADEFRSAEVAVEWVLNHAR